MIARYRLLTILMMGAALAGCKQNATAPASTEAPAATAAANDDASLDKAVDAFIDGYFQHNPVFAASAGKHEYDGKLPDYSPAGLKAATDAAGLTAGTLALARMPASLAFDVWQASGGTWPARCRA